jgi:hypothetical protein
MTIALDLEPEIERGLLTQATARGLSLSDFVKARLLREAHVSPELRFRRTGQELIDACAKVRGLPSEASAANWPLRRLRGRSETGRFGWASDSVPGQAQFSHQPFVCRIVKGRQQKLLIFCTQKQPGQRTAEVLRQD